MFVVPPETLEMAKALADPTRFQVYSRIAEADAPVTVKELGRLFPLHHSAIRIHLHKLIEAGLIASETVHHRGVVGRPEISFRLGPRSINIVLPPRNLHLLAELALEYSASNNHRRDGLIAFGEEWGRNMVRDLYPAPAEPVDWQLAVERVAEALQDLGCMSHVQTRCNGDYHLIESNCLFLPLSRSHMPTVCLIHQALIRGMLKELTGRDDVTLDHERSIARDNEECCLTRVIPPNRPAT